MICSQIETPAPREIDRNAGDKSPISSRAIERSEKGDFQERGAYVLNIQKTPQKAESLDAL